MSTRINMDTLVKEPPTLYERMKMTVDGKEIRPVNEYKCPGCGKWDHEQEKDPVWEFVEKKEVFQSIENPDRKTTIDDSYHTKTCECGKVTRWLDTGFMGVMAQINVAEDGEAIWGAFDHVLEKSK